MCGADIDGLLRTANTMDNDPCGMPLWSTRRGDLITLLARATSIKICPNHDALKHVKDPLSDAIDVCGTLDEAELGSLQMRRPDNIQKISIKLVVSVVG